MPNDETDEEYFDSDADDGTLSSIPSVIDSLEALKRSIAPFGVAELRSEVIGRAAQQNLSQRALTNLGILTQSNFDVLDQISSNFPGIGSSIDLSKVAQDTLSSFAYSPAYNLPTQSDLLGTSLIGVENFGAKFPSVVDKYLPTFQTHLRELEDSVASKLAETVAAVPQSAFSALTSIQDSVTGVLNERFAELDTLTSVPATANFSSLALGGMLEDILAYQQTVPTTLANFPALKTLLDLQVESLFDDDLSTDETADFPNTDPEPNREAKKKGTLSPWQILILVSLLELFLTDVYNATKSLVYQEPTSVVATENLEVRHEELRVRLEEFEAFAKPILTETLKVHEYVVVRDAPLRVDSDAKAAVEVRVYPNTRVEVQDIRGGWMYVEYADDLEGIERMGWIHKKHLKPL